MFCSFCIFKNRITMPQRCEGPDSLAWKCQEQSACSLHDQSPAPPASSAAPLSSEPPSSWSPQPYRQDKQHTRSEMCSTGRQLFIYVTPLDTYFLDFSSLRILASALALFSSLLASESWSLLASILKIKVIRVKF